eukprot:8655633-Alexandrium_andersonii.AAC.1
MQSGDCETTLRAAQLRPTSTWCAASAGRRSCTRICSGRAEDLKELLSNCRKVRKTVRYLMKNSPEP